MILLVGAGAVGTVLAAHLGAAGTPYRLYARDKDRAAFAAAGEIRVEAAQPQQPALVAPPPQLASTLALDGIDTVLICVKYPALDALLGQLPAIPAGCSVVSTLNGAEALRTIRARLPQARVLPLTVMYNAQLLGPLHAQLTTRAEIIVGDGDAALAARFAGPAMSTKTAPGDSAVWGKLLINLANAVCAATHTTFKDLLTQRDLRAIYVAVLDEATSLLARAGHAYQLPIAVPYPLYRQIVLRGGALPWWFARTRNGLREGAYPSMVSDVEQGRVTEVRQLNGEIVALGRAHGIDAPVNARLLEIVERLRGTAPAYLSPAVLRAELGV